MKEIDPKKLARFEKWCRHNFASSSARKFVSDVRSLVRYQGFPPHSKRPIARLRDYKLAWQKWEDWGEGGPLGVRCPTIPDQKKVGRRHREPKRLREAVSYDRSDFQRMVKAVEKSDELEGIVLSVLMRTPLRVCDVLRAPVGVLRSAMKRQDGIATIVVKGGKSTVYSIRNGGAAEAAWRRLLDHEKVRKAPATWHVASAMMGDPDAKAEAGYGAYERVRRALARFGVALDVSGRVHLHRSRRTIGVLLAGTGASLEEVQKTMVHSSYETTKGYLDEARAVESATLLRRLE